MKEHYVSYDCAVKLKELGFSGEVTGKYIDCPNDPTLFQGMLYQSWNLEDDEILAPRIDQAAKWLREQYGIHVSANPYSDYSTDADGKVCDEWYFWSFELTRVPSGAFIDDADGEYDTYESALSAGISKALELLGKEDKE